MRPALLAASGDLQLARSSVSVANGAAAELVTQLARGDCPIVVAVGSGHDFAHLIVERRLRLPSGFFVNIAKGYSIQQLSDAAIIRTLGAEPYVAEILARALGSLATGACTVEQFPQLVGTELGQMGLGVPPGVSVESGMRMLEELQSTMRRFAELAPGESVELQFGEAS